MEEVSPAASLTALKRRETESDAQGLDVSPAASLTALKRRETESDVARVRCFACGECDGAEAPRDGERCRKG